MPDTSKSSKYNNAVTRATGGDVAEGDANAPAIPSNLVTTCNDAELAAIMNDGTLEFAPQIASLEQGQMIMGILEGNGPEAEFVHSDKVTGIVTTNTVQTWIIAAMDGGKRISILSSVQLDRKLPPFVGGMVKIVRGKDINVDGGRRVTDYLVAGKKLEGGQRRSWASKPVIEASATTAPQLPAGQPDGNSATAS